MSPKPVSQEQYCRGEGVGGPKQEEGDPPALCVLPEQLRYWGVWGSWGDQRAEMKGARAGARR